MRRALARGGAAHAFAGGEQREREAECLSRPWPVRPPQAPPPPPALRLPGTAPEVALTFDDGPNALTASFAEVLRRERVPAVFFWMGVRSAPGLADMALLVRDGHQVGCHSVSHRRLTDLGDADVRWEIAEASRALGQARGRTIRHFRPPYGEYDGRTLACARTYGMRVVLWEVDTLDWALAETPQQIVANALTARPGSIILLHQYPQTLAVLSELIGGLRSLGLGFRLLPEAPIR